jgi:hypothetical protein
VEAIVEKRGMAIVKSAGLGYVEDDVVNFGKRLEHDDPAGSEG